MSRKELFEEIKAMVVEVIDDPSFDASSIGENTKAKEDLGLNSIGLLYLIMSVQERYSIEIENEKASAIETMGDLLDVVEGLI